MFGKKKDKDIASDPFSEQMLKVKNEVKGPSKKVTKVDKAKDPKIIKKEAKPSKEVKAVAKVEKFGKDQVVIKVEKVAKDTKVAKIEKTGKDVIKAEKAGKDIIVEDVDKDGKKGKTDKDKKSKKKDDKKKDKKDKDGKDKDGKDKDGKDKKVEKQKEYKRYSIMASIRNGGRPLNDPPPVKKVEEEAKTCKQKYKACTKRMKGCCTLSFYFFLCLFLSSLIVATPVVLNWTIMQKRCFCGINMFCNNLSGKPGHGYCESCVDYGGGEDKCINVEPKTQMRAQNCLKVCYGKVPQVQSFDKQQSRADLYDQQDPHEFQSLFLQ